MQLPMLKPTKRRRILIDRFRGYEQTPAVSAGAFYDMKNLSGERAPLLCVRRRRTVAEMIDDCPTDCVLAMAGRSSPVVLDAHGTLWCGGQALPRLWTADSFSAPSMPRERPCRSSDGSFC